MKEFKLSNEGSGRYFRIDGRVWAKVCDLGLNEAIVYLVLAQGTGRNNRETRWSATAAKTHCGIAFDRAKAAILRLVENKIVQYGEKHTEMRPRYELLSWAEISEVESQEAIEPDYIWLPNAIVTGSQAGEASPVKCLRQAGDVWTLRLFVDLYNAQNLRDDGGITPSILRLEHKRKKLGQDSGFTLYAFVPAQMVLTEEGRFAAHTERRGKRGEKNPIWASVEQLQNLGLLSFVPHLWENASEAAEIIHPYGFGAIGESIERRLADAAYMAAVRMAIRLGVKPQDTIGAPYLLAFPSDLRNVQLVGIGRLKYRPQTRRTAMWQTTLQASAESWISRYEGMFSEMREKMDGEKGTVRWEWFQRKCWDWCVASFSEEEAPKRFDELGEYLLKRWS